MGIQNQYQQEEKKKKKELTWDGVMKSSRSLSFSAPLKDAIPTDSIALFQLHVFTLP